MSIELKIKSKHLALEPGIIRFEERKLLKQLKWLRSKQEKTHKLENKFNSLVSHRKVDVRRESRATFLARAYIAGYAYSDVEKSVKDLAERHYYITPRVVAMVKKYFNYKITEEDINNWYCDRLPGSGLSLPS